MHAEENFLDFFDISQELLMACSFSHKHKCCDLCAKLCACSPSGYAAANFLPMLNASVHVSARKRTGTLKQKELLIKKLLVLRKEQVIPTFEKFAGCSGEIVTPTLTTFLNTFSTFQINQILKHVDVLFSLEDVMSIVEISKKDHAVKAFYC